MTKNNKNMISCHVGPLRADGVPKMQHQRWRENIKVVVGEFKIRVISKWSYNSVQLSSYCHNFFVLAPICSLFDALDS